MILIFGTKRKFKNLGTLENCHCSRCNNTSDWNFMEYRDWFTLFWIPVFPISARKEYLECPICRQIYDVPKNQLFEFNRFKEIKKVFKGLSIDKLKKWGNIGM